jgi:GntR family transcriptional regulator/MocR family aminotransferase
VDALAGLFNTPDKAPTLIYTTPSDQFPLGTTLSLSRRLTMLEQVANRHCWIIEDDYDSEYRFHQRPLSSLQGLDNHQRVIYLGTFSKVMFPGLRLGYLVVPAAMVAACRQALRKTGQDAPLIWQAAMADFIQGGHFASHIRRMRRLYGDKQRQFIHLLDQQLHHWLEPVPTGAGMQLACWFKHPVDTRRLLATAQAQDLIVPLLSRCYLAPPERDGVQLGYAGVPPQEMARQVVKLRSVFENS